MLANNFSAIPTSYFCSITNQIMIDPVFTTDGYTYEREAIEEWLSAHNTSPKTGQILSSKQLFPNWDKKGDIAEFLQAHPELYQTDEIYLPKAWLNQLTAAIKNNQITVVQEWLSKDNRLLTIKLENDYMAFHLAAQFGSEKLTQVILEQLRHSKQLNQLLKPVNFAPLYLNSLLEKAVFKQDKETFLLLSTMMKWKQTNVAQQLAIKGAKKPLAWLLEQGLPLDYRDEEGNTLLLLSVLHNKIKLTKFLLSKGADPRAVDAQQRTPFCIAVEKGNIKAAKLLINEQEVMQTWGEDQASPLHVAVRLGDAPLVELLLQSAKTLVDLTDIERNTPLHIVAKAGHAHLIALLLKAGADHKAKNLLYQTAFKLAKLHNKTHTADLIEQTVRALKREKQTEMNNLRQQLNEQAKRIEQLEQALKQLQSAPKIEIEAEKKPMVNQFLQKKNEQPAGRMKILYTDDSKICSLQLLPNNQLAVGALNGVIKIFDLNNQTYLKSLFNQSPVFSLQALANDQLASGLSDGTIKIWDLSNGTCLKSFTAHSHMIHCLRLLANGELMSTADDGSIKIWDLNGRCIEKFCEHGSAIRFLHQLPDGTLLTAAVEEGIRKWDIAMSSNSIRPNSKPPLIPIQGIPVIQPLAINDFIAVAVSSSIHIYELNHGTRITILNDHSDPISCLQLLPSGQLISAARDNTIKVWDLASNKCVKTLKGHTMDITITCLQPLPNGELISGSADGTVRIWDLTEFVKVNELEKQLVIIPWGRTIA